MPQPPANPPRPENAPLREREASVSDGLDDASSPAASPRHEALEFLLRRMRHRGDFPALSASVVAINRITTSESESVAQLSDLILRDFSLTNKLLRLVNSAHYRPTGSSISTVSRAVIVLGFDAVRNIAITVLLFEHLQDKDNAAHLKEEFLRACLAGLLAREIGQKLKMRDLEQAYICSVFHNLGRLLSQYYFPQETEDIRRVTRQTGCREDIAAQQVLGVSFEELGTGLAQAWGFPPVLVDSMRKPAEGPVRRPDTHEGRLRALSACANELCDAVALLPAAERDQAIRQIAGRFVDAVPVTDEGVREALARSIDELDDLARVIQVDLGDMRIGRHVHQYLNAAENAAAPADHELLPGELSERGADTLDDAGDTDARPVDAQAVLTAGIQDISNALLEGFKLNDILRITLETMYRAMCFKHVVLCIRDARTNTMTGRFGFGPEVEKLTRSLRFSLATQPDNVFNVATAKGADVLIDDIDEPHIARRIPEWYRKALPSQTFVLLPLTLKGTPVALIYADKDHAGDIAIGERELALLRTLRNQALLAIKQSA
ncbi:MAG: HDOD domain-containing protein [Thauera sp.]|nr:HDOD domain-containing protein [Thauera sp.]